MEKETGMASKIGKKFRKWACFGTKSRGEAYRNQPRIFVTECPSPTTPPSSRSNSSSSAYEEEETAEISIRTGGKIHPMGMKITPRYRCDHFRPGDGRHAMISVAHVEVGLFAHGFGLRPGDVIHKVNDRECSGVQDTKNIFWSVNSTDLRLEILRKVKDHRTGKTELKKMIIGNNSDVSTLEIIQVVEVESSWSLSGPETFLHTGDPRRVYLQFNCTDYPTVIYDEHQGLVLDDHLAIQESQGRALFKMHIYESLSCDAGITVILQHEASGRCVAVVNESVIMMEPVDLEMVTSEHSAFLFKMHIPEGQPSCNCTFRSLVQAHDGKALYLGFQAYGGRVEGSAIAVHVNEQRVNGHVLESPQRNEVLFTLIKA
ncbi:predicted protein [Nematostella vectensis]|uniref:PDZ domain-containing protein n=1 Tax=Nematostella vectensis TaxID=45351 RepID=A7SM26_NEMVE|nr:uncharacterized protein LOC5506646 [Nematostella vectensis]XP_048588538.1 uncharacterized protein LOC5506646 [Nematostella vectensis]EDO35254.1 predicted protein [Nematostella vectensis]|eukprot:XP_001627354.1 predicted protein [Nematostella vectensis]